MGVPALEKFQVSDLGLRSRDRNATSFRATSLILVAAKCMRSEMLIFYRLFVLASAVLVLAGCAAVDHLNAYLEQSEREADEARIAKASSACNRYGFTAGTDAYASCIQTEVNNIKNREAISAAATSSERRQSDSKSDSSQSASLPKVTACRKTLLGVECTTR